MPALAGVRLMLDGHLISTDSRGRAIFVQQHNLLPHTLKLIDEAVQKPTLRYRFSRWDGQRDPNQAFTSTVTGLPMRSAYLVTAAFAVQFPVLPQIVRQDGQPADLAEVSSISVKSDTGSVSSLFTDRASWLDGLRPVFHQSVLSAQVVTYAVQSIVVRGSNVVDSGRQTFQPASGSHPTFTGQYHDLLITAHDALFGSSVGSTAIVTFTDGSQVKVALGKNHTAVVPRLPRGRYSVMVKAGLAIVALDVFTLSKDRTADVAVITSKDFCVLAAILVTLALALFAIGRHHRLGRVLARLRRAPQPDDFRLPQLDELLT